MHTPISQDAVDDRIHHFLERKSPLKRLSESIAEHLAVPRGTRKKSSDISYEQTRWHTGRSAHSL
jgi:hypothetical protein